MPRPQDQPPAGVPQSLEITLNKAFPPVRVVPSAGNLEPRRNHFVPKFTFRRVRCAPYSLSGMGLRKAVALRAAQGDNDPVMRALVGLVVIAALVLGVYYFSLKRLPAGEGGGPATQSISLTGVRGDLLSIAQAERMYIAQNSGCGSMDNLVSSGTLSVARPGRDGYTYSIDCSGGGGNFTIAARHAPAPADAPALHYPTMVIDQTMQVRQLN